jgi:hypothetical protein
MRKGDFDEKRIPQGNDTISINWRYTPTHQSPPHALLRFQTRAIVRRVRGIACNLTFEKWYEDGQSFINRSYAERLQEI